ncbi:O-antigen polymerase [Bacillus mesophilum]|uniref:Oligosaccharide repeat unit polymerase n=1 Tax=Bacillus mesophilum TaxID=1071718 RepID=A0A7V7RLD7_9BACI|nr:O-antigen polymerase [Bacillus mesophilum]KAB2332603.1 oligosaccharide repeat unit polymerase [Bacillus mesophilum]
MRIKNLKTFNIYMFILLISPLSCLIILYDSKPNGYNNLWVLPLIFLVLSLITVNVLKNLADNITLSVIYFGYFIRFVITPLFLSLGNYTTVFNTLVDLNIQYAIIFMVYEIIIVFLCIEFYLIINKNVKKYKNKRIEINSKNYKNINLMFIILTLFCISIYLYIPEIGKYYTSFFSNNTDALKLDYDFDNIASRGSIDRILNTLFVFIFNIFRYIIPVYLLQLIYLKLRPSRFKFILSIIICLSPFLIVSESNIQPFFGLLFNILMMLKLYPSKSRKIIATIGILGVVGLVGMVIEKILSFGNWQGTSGVASIALTLNAYFPGVGNVAAAYNVDVTNKLITFVSDLVRTIPFNGTLFPGVSTEINTTSMYNTSNYVTGQIIPNISYTSYYLGVVLSPIIPVILSLYALKMHKKANLNKDFWIYFFYIFVSIRIALIPTLYNPIAFFSILFSQILPLGLFCLFINRSKFANRNIAK